MSENLAPPIAKRVPTSVVLHSETCAPTITRGCATSENPEVTAYLDAENAYTAEIMRHTEPLQESLYNEMLARIKESDAEVPGAARGLALLRAHGEGGRRIRYTAGGAMRTVRPKK